MSSIEQSSGNLLNNASTSSFAVLIAFRIYHRIDSRSIELRNCVVAPQCAVICFLAVNSSIICPAWNNLPKVFLPSLDLTPNTGRSQTYQQLLLTLWRLYEENAHVVCSDSYLCSGGGSYHCSRPELQ